MLGLSLHFSKMRAATLLTTASNRHHESAVKGLDEIEIGSHPTGAVISLYSALGKFATFNK